MATNSPRSTPPSLGLAATGGPSHGPSSKRLRQGAQALPGGTALVTDRAVLATAVAAVGHRIQLCCANSAGGEAATREADHILQKIQSLEASIKASD